MCASEFGDYWDCTVYHAVCLYKTVGEYTETVNADTIVRKEDKLVCDVILCQKFGMVLHCCR